MVTYNASCVHCILELTAIALKSTALHGCVGINSEHYIHTYISNMC